MQRLPRSLQRPSGCRRSSPRRSAESMAATQIALLRGINVGRGNRIAMADLRALGERLGHRDVRTLLNSGNIVLTAAARSTPETTARRLEQAIADELGITLRVTVLDAAELARVVAENPLQAVADNPSRLMVGVLAREADTKKLEPRLAAGWAPEPLAPGRRGAIAGGGTRVGPGGHLVDVLDLGGGDLEPPPRLRVVGGAAQGEGEVVANGGQRVVRCLRVAAVRLALQRQHDTLHHRVEELGLVAEMPVDRAARDAGGR